MQSVYTDIPEKAHVSKVYEYNVAAMLSYNSLHMYCCFPFYIGTFRSICLVPNMAVVCSSLISCFPVMLLGYFLNDFEMVSVAPFITSITIVLHFTYYYYYYYRLF